VSAQGNGFKNANLQLLDLALTSGSVDLPADVNIAFRVSARRTCAGGGRPSGTARLWFNGLPIDSGLVRDAGSRFDVTVAGKSRTVFLRKGFDLSLLPGVIPQAADAGLNSAAACPARPFVTLGTWGTDLP
jgi:hypothetical protein